LTKLLREIAPLRFGAGRECSFPAALSAATKTDYEWLMGCSGAAFDVTIDLDGFDPLAATPRDPDTLTRAARAAGVRLDDVPPPYDEELRELVGARIREAIDDKLPPLIRGAVGPPEYGLIVGYTDDDRFLVRTFFDKGDKPSEIGWSDFIDGEHGAPVFLDRATTAPREAAAAAGLDDALRRADASDAALEGWAAALRDDARWADTKHAGAAAFADQSMRTVLADKRRAAAHFLRGLRSVFASTPGADLLRAAESYGYVVEALEKTKLGAFDASVAMRFLDPGHRRSLAKALDAVLRNEREAHDALRAARATIR
jgi:hypothetical protein